MAIQKYLSGRENLVGQGYPLPVPIELDVVTFEGAIVWGEDGNFYYSDGTDWVPLLERAIETPVALIPTNEIEKKKMRLSPFASNLGYTQTGVEFQISLTNDFENDIFKTFVINEPVSEKELTIEELENDVFDEIYGMPFYWRGRYVAGGRLSEFSSPFLQEYPKRFKDPEPLSSNGEITNIFFITPYETAFPSYISYKETEVDIYSSLNGEPDQLVKTFVYGPNPLGRDGEIDATANLVDLDDSEPYFWRARTRGTDTRFLDDYVSDSSDFRSFFKVPATMILQYDLNKGSNSRRVYLPLGTTDTNVFVDWGDGTTFGGSPPNPDGEHFVGTVSSPLDPEGVFHDYDEKGVYEIKISGSLKSYGKDGGSSLYLQSQEKLINVISVGEGIGIESLDFAFDQCKNLFSVPKTIPDTINSFESTFRDCMIFDGNIGEWDVSSVTTMRGMFEGCVVFNRDISDWNVTDVTDFSSMFSGCTRFSADLSKWLDDSFKSVNAQFIDRMFEDCEAFDSDLSNWNVSSCNSLVSVFDGCTNFNNGGLNGIRNWETTNIQDMTNLFRGCASFDQPLDGWNTRNVSDMTGVFEGCSSFNGDISTWDTSSVLSMVGMFRNATAFNGDISEKEVPTNGDESPPNTYTAWDVSSCIDFSSMFLGATAFDSDISNWTLNTTNDVFMVSMFESTSSFDQPLDSWNTSSVVDMRRMFFSNAVFNQSLDGWDVSGVGTDGNGGFANMFNGCTVFDQYLGSWDVTNAKTFYGMFWGCRDFGLSGTTGVVNWLAGSPAAYAATDVQYMFRECPSFNDDLSSWNTSLIQRFDGLFYQAINFNNGGNAGIDGWDMSSAKSLAFMFDGATDFNQPIGSWDVSSVTDFRYMFARANGFDQSIGAWDVSSGENFHRMFFENGTWNSGTGIATSGFNQDLSNWFQYSGTKERDMRSMFNQAYAFNNGNASGVAGTMSWNTSGAEMRAMFFAAYSFNQDISSFDASGSTSLQAMFNGAIVFNNGESDGIDNWDVSGVTDMANMFSGAVAFNQPVGSWDVSNVTDMRNMFLNANSFNQDLLEWNVSSVTNFESMFEGADNFNGEVYKWRPFAAINMESMFEGTSFNRYIEPWFANILDLTTEDDLIISTEDGKYLGVVSSTNEDVSPFSISSFNAMFKNNTAFNQDMTSWDVSTVVDMNDMLFNASSFDQSLGGWNVQNVIEMSGMLQNTNLSEENYSDTLIGWITNPPSLQEDVTLNAEDATLNVPGQNAKNTLRTTYNWTIYDGETPQ